ncbi:hypothetical protein [Paludibacterium sp.]|uniref:hypothetical protein n=1 Tax=Paludibacterium sp. TaxID=1917523 RepID=UPI001D305B91|nr:hypothetical protein [Paludibacterium sp.]MBV8059938.1 hypothetical protein [Alphaproteobacteria bacterium]MBV8646713.1 hypothetical protein [Paludibacterium sp.]
MIDKICLFVMFSLFSALSLAGERGYNAVYIDYSGDISYFKVYREKYYDTGVNKNCWATLRGSGVDSFYYKKTPNGLDRSLIDGVLKGDSAAIKKVSMFLRGYKDDQLLSGFDVAFFVDKSGVQLISVGAYGSYNRESYNINRKSPNYIKIDRAICQSLKKVDVEFNP